MKNVCRQIGIWLVCLTLLTTLAFGNKTTYTASEFSTELGRAVTDIYNYGTIKLSTGERRYIENFQPVQNAPQGAWTFLLNNFYNVNSAAVNRASAQLQRAISSEISSEIYFFSQPTRINNLGTSYQLFYRFPDTSSAIINKIKPQIDVYLNDEFKDYKGKLSVYTTSTEWGLSATHYFGTNGISKDELKSQLYYLLNATGFILEKVDRDIRIEKDAAVSLMLNSPLSSLSKNQFYALFPSWKGYEAKKSPQGGAWKWSYGSGDSKQSLYFVNKGTQLEMYVQLKPFSASPDTAENSLKNWIKANPFPHSADWSLTKDNPAWLRFHVKYDGKTGAELVNAYKAFESYSKQLLENWHP